MNAPNSVSLVAALLELAETAQRVARELDAEMTHALAMVRATVRGGGTLFFCGNGGSAADAQHIATEYVVRYRRNRRAYPAIALTTDTSLLTAAGNDFGFDHIFSRQVEALANPGDLLVIHSTSGNSPNVLRAAEAARVLGVQVLALSANDGGALRSLVDHDHRTHESYRSRAGDSSLYTARYLRRNRAESLEMAIHKVMMNNYLGVNTSSDMSLAILSANDD